MDTTVPCKTLSNLLVSRLIFVTAFLLSPVYAIATTHDVSVNNNTFNPNSLTIEVGDTVRWNNSSGRSHDVTADDGSFASQTSSSFTYSRTFNSVEEILYHCSVHSSAGRNRDTSMNGLISVVAAVVSTDVSVESVKVKGYSQEAGEDFTVMATLNNTGAASSGPFNISFYASVDSDITSSDTLIGTDNISDIAMNESTNIEESVNLPQDLGVGDYFIGAIIDLDDTDPINNVNFDEMTVFVFDEFIMNAGLNDAWYNPATNGQGFFVTVFPDLGFVTLAWFTYDTELPPMDATANLGDPGHRWLTAGGVIDGDKAVMNIELTSGGLFDAASEVLRTDPVGSDGTLTLKFDNCSMGSIEYDITSINAQGTVPIQRVAEDNELLCIALLKESQPNL